MPKAKTISLTKKDYPDYLDFDWLRVKGLEHIQQLSGGLWTDHNLHDPGITMLEALCYAVADIGYRTNHDIKDLLAEEHNIGADDNFFRASEILGCNPLTILDFRKLLMDIEGVENAWLEISKESELPLYVNYDENQFVSEGDYFADSESPARLELNGLYMVTLQLDQNTTRSENDILNEAHERLHSHRNLCEDFFEISILKEEKIGIAAEIHISPDARPEKVAAHVFQKIDSFLSPSIRFYTLQELLEKGRSIEEIFAGRPSRKLSELLEEGNKIGEIFAGHKSENLRKYLSKGQTLEGLFSGSPLSVLRAMLGRGKTMEEIFLGEKVNDLSEILDVNETLKNIFIDWPVGTLKKELADGGEIKIVFKKLPNELLGHLTDFQQEFVQLFGQWPVDVLQRLLMGRNGIENIFSKKRIEEIKEDNGAGKEQLFSKKELDRLKTRWDVNKKIKEVFDGWHIKDIKYLLKKEKSIEELFGSWPTDVLGELFRTGKTLDELFAGRLFAGKSHGFIDIKELEKLKRPKAIFVSDLYRVIMDEVYNVESVNSLRVFSESENADWELALPDFSVPHFSADMSVSKIILKKSNIPVRLDEEEVVGRYKRRFSNLQKVLQPPANLDLPIPKGHFRKDLKKYKSVQYEFPSVYNIGRNGAGDKDGFKRKAQALQLKAYLMFYDQVLANYLAQLSNVRKLFSLNKENNNRTFFTQSISDAPGSDQIINFLKNNHKGPFNGQSPCGDSKSFVPQDDIAVPAQYFDHLEDRDFHLNKIIYHFKENDTAFRFDEVSCTFDILDKRLGTVLLTSAKQYDSEEDAREVYEVICFLGTQRSSYEKEQVGDNKVWNRGRHERQGAMKTRSVQPSEAKRGERDKYVKPQEAASILNRPDHIFIFNENKNKVEIWDEEHTDKLLESTWEVTDEKEARELYEQEMNAGKFYFRLVYKPEGYLQYLTTLREEDGSKNMYKRRNLFLDHLSSRFAHDFTDYVLIMYSVNDRSSDDERIISDKLNFLRHFPEVSRDRGKGFNYLKKGKTWGSDNVAGLKKRVATLMGLDSWNRERLNHFKVVQKEAAFKYRLLNDRGELVFESAKSFPEKVNAAVAFEEMKEWAKNEKAYVNVDFGTEGVYGFKLVNPDNGEDIAFHPVTYRLARQRNRAKQYLLYWFGGEGTPVKAVKDHNGWRFELYWEAYDRMPKLLLRGGEVFPDKDSALREGKDWLEYNKDEIKKALDLFDSRPHLLESHPEWFVYFEKIINWTPIEEIEEEENYNEYRKALNGLKGELKNAEKWLEGLNVLQKEESEKIAKLIDEVLEKEEEKDDYLLKKELENICKDTGNTLAELNTSVIKLTYDKAEKKYSFFIKQFGGEIALHPDDYETALRRNVVMRDGLEFLLKIGGEFKAEYTEEEVGWAYQMTGDWPVKKNVDSPVTYEEKTLLESKGRFGSEEEAWNALDEFLAISIKEDGLHEGTDYGNGGGYGFNFTKNGSAFADHPHCYPTLKSREKARDYLFQYVRKADVLYVDYDTSESVGCHEGLWCIELYPILYSGTDRSQSRSKGPVLWRCLPGQAKKEDLKINLLYFMEMASEPDFYLISQKGAKFEVALLDYCDQVVAKSPKVYDSQLEARGAVLERIKYARLYPYVNLDYDPTKRMNHCGNLNPPTNIEKVGVRLWYFPYEDDQSPIPLEGAAQPTNDPYARIEEPQGAIVFEINKAFEGLEAAKQGLEYLKGLLKEKGNLQRTETTACGPFSFRVADAGEVIAVHPEKYTSYHDLQLAKELTMRNLSKEGFHLVEHILLRPRSGNKKVYSIEVLDQNGTPMLVDAQQFKEEPTSAEFQEFMTDVQAAAQMELDQLAAGSEADDLDVDLNLGDRKIAMGLTTPHDLASKRAMLETILRTSIDQYRTLEINAALDTEKMIDRFKVPGLSKEEVDARLAGKDHFERYLPNTDPYSFWVTLVLPYWPKRFQNLNFRAFFENTIRMETPAHIALRIAWVAPQEMEVFEKNYAAWLEHFGPDVTRPMLQAQNDLLETIESFSNKLPVVRLGEVRVE